MNEQSKEEGGGGVVDVHLPSILVTSPPPPLPPPAPPFPLLDLFYYSLQPQRKPQKLTNNNSTNLQGGIVNI